MFRTPVGRAQFAGGVFYRLWPLLARVAAAHRATLARRARIVAVVGSTGKTTTARAVAAVLGLAPGRLTDNYKTFVALGLLRVGPRSRHGVLEIGIDGPGQMREYARLVRPQIAVVTSIGSDHNRSLSTLEATRLEKSAMVQALAPDGIAVLNGDDENIRWMQARTVAKPITFGFGAENDVRATDVALDWPHGTRFRLRAGGEVRAMRVQLLGKHQLYAILAAVAVGLVEGVPLDDIVQRLEALPATPGRLQLVALASGAFLLRDDFKSSLETIESALDVLAELPAARRVVVLGDVEEPPGSQGPIYARLGERIAEVADRAVILGERRRYAAGARRKGMRREDMLAAPDVLHAIAAARAEIRSGDILLVKGRSTQRLERVALALAGRTVRCNVKHCDAMLARCDRCPMLERGWDGLRAVI